MPWANDAVLMCLAWFGFVVLAVALSSLMALGLIKACDLISARHD